MSYRRPTAASLDDARDALVAKARKLRARGEVRKAAVALREACMRDESAAALWTLYAALEAKLAHAEEAARAFKHALWLRRSAGDAERARSTQVLLDRLELPSAA